MILVATPAALKLNPEELWACQSSITLRASLMVTRWVTCKIFRVDFYDFSNLSNDLKDCEDFEDYLKIVTLHKILNISMIIQDLDD